MDCSPPGSSVHGDSPGKNTGVSCHALHQGIFPTQELDPGLPNCRWILYQLNYQGNPKIGLVQSLSRVRLFATPLIAARQASLSITNSRSLLRLMSKLATSPQNGSALL